MTEYITKDGDRLDQIIRQHYGTLNNDLFRLVMAANENLTYTSVFAAGVKVNLPVATDLQSQQPSLKLWDVVRRTS